MIFYSNQCSTFIWLFIFFILDSFFLLSLHFMFTFHSFLTTHTWTTINYSQHWIESNAMLFDICKRLSSYAMILCLCLCVSVDSGLIPKRFIRFLSAVFCCCCDRCHYLLCKWCNSNMWQSLTRLRMGWTRGQRYDWFDRMRIHKQPTKQLERLFQPNSVYGRIIPFARTTSTTTDIIWDRT